METESNFRKIKVYCYEHQTICEVKSNPQIVCTIEEHTLSNNFPQAEFWEYCCDCQTFLPTKPDVVRNVIKACPNCDRTAIRRFVCQNCKTAAFESDESARGKTYCLNGANGIQPNCPGCQTMPQNGAAILHKCQEIKSEFFTSRQTCPFCLEKTDQSVNVSNQTLPNTIFSANPEQCPQCQTWNPPGTVFCGKCRHQLRMDVAVTNLGSNVNKTQLLGSLCPNCSTPIPPDSDFCGECGQAVKKSIAPPPAPPKKLAVESSTINLPAYSTTASTSNNNMRNIIIGVSAVFVFIVIAVVASNVSKSSGSTTDVNGNYPTTIVNGNSRMSNGRSINNGSAPPSTDYRIGRTGVLTTNARIRSASNKNSEIVGVHYRGAKVRVLDVDSYTTNEGDTTWFRIKVLENGCDAEGKRGCGNDNPNASDGVGWMQASDEGWMNSKTISLQ